MTIGVGIVALLWGARGRLRTGARVALVSGVVGFAIAGATSGVIGLVPAAAVAIAVSARRGLLQRGVLAAVVAATVLASLGVVVYRSGDYGQFFSFLGVKHASAAASKNIETYPQHTLLAYIGLRIWLHHPIVGAGFEASKDYATFSRELPAAHARFPHVAPSAFPGKTRIYGVQDLYVQTLADLGVVGPRAPRRPLRRRDRTGALGRAARPGSGRVPRPPRRLLARLLPRALDGAGHHRGHPARRAHLARFRRCRHAIRRRCSLMARALVTGGAGFIGSNLVRALLERGDDVRVLDNFSTGNRANLEGLDVEIVEGELRSYERVHNAVRGSEVVYHLGALGSVPRSVQDPLTSSAVNVEGTLNVLLAARDEGVRRVVFSSSSSVYGSKSELPVDGVARLPTRSRRTASRSSPPSGTASASRACTSRSSRSCCATSTSSGRGRARSRSTPRWCRSSSPRSRRASR